jgi:hypothetical protein
MESRSKMMMIVIIMGHKYKQETVGVISWSVRQKERVLGSEEDLNIFYMYIWIYIYLESIMKSNKHFLKRGRRERLKERR